jgi:predicted HAD superfamily Cof-like phosphohydrolase
MTKTSPTTTAHYDRVRAFMTQARQETPATPVVPGQKVRLLRAKLILEEALETVRALGVEVHVLSPNDDDRVVISEEESKLGFELRGMPDLTEIADGCADISVVTTGTLIACGIQDQPILEAVDQNNLDKFGPGHSWREDGKLIKPPGHKKVDLEPLIQAMASTQARA